MEVREAVRTKRWQRDDPDSVAIGSELVAMRNQALAEDIPLLEPVSVHKLDQTMRRIPDNTGLGSDCVQPGAIKHAPVEAKLEFCRILDSVMREEFCLGVVVRDRSFAPKGWSGAWERTTNRPASHNRSNSGSVVLR